jgi:apolipoprotein N-acyltransferase
MVIVLPLLSGLLSFASFAPLSLWWLAPISLALLLRVLVDQPCPKRALAIALYGVVFFGPLLAWSNTYVGDIPWLILTILQVTLLLPLAAIPFNSHRPYLFLLFPSLFIFVEALRTRFPFGGFGWGRLAFSQADSPFAGVARWGGAPALSFMVCTIAILLLFVLRREWKYAGGVMLVLIFSFALMGDSHTPLPRNFSILAVQGGVPTLGLDFNSRARAVFELHRQATEKYFATQEIIPDLILWPENAVDVDPLRDSVVSAELQTLVDKFNRPIIVGAVLERGANFANASILWKPGSGLDSIYIKQHLTPFGEYIPWRTIAEIVSPYARRVVDFVPGNNSIIHRVGAARIAPIICFELLDDVIGRKMAALSNVIVVQTNSATFGDSPESAQQLGITRIRAIEHQRYTVSVATTGISAVIDPQGRILQQSSPDTVAVLDGKVALLERNSFSDQHGGVIELLLIFLPMVLLFILVLTPGLIGARAKRRKSRSHL